MVPNLKIAGEAGGEGFRWLIHVWDKRGNHHFLVINSPN